MVLRDEGKRIRWMQRFLLMEITATKTTENHELEQITKQIPKTQKPESTGWSYDTHIKK